ncbi:MAG: dihydrodipicolinate synthase family protein [Flavisolibacter sp.]
MTTGKIYSGVVIPAVTPFTPGLKLDHDAVNRIFEHFHASSVHPFILGTTGEGASIPFSMKKEFVQLAGKLKKEGSLLYGAISSNALEESIVLANYGFDKGLDVAVSTLPSYYTLTETSMLKYLEQLAENVPGPLMIYNIPSTTHMSIPLHVIDHLSYHPNIVGVKDSERSEERLKQSIELWKDRKDFSHFPGWAAKSAEALLMGSDGLVPSTGNFEAKLYADLYIKARQNDKDKAYELQKMSDALGNLYQQGRTLGESIWALKVLMKELGLCESYVMPPVYLQSKEEETKLIEGMKRILNEETKAKQ